MQSTFVFPFMLAIFWATLGCVFIRATWLVRYNIVIIFWLMTVFAFTLVNRILFLDRMLLLDALTASALAFFMPIISHFGYQKLFPESSSSEKYFSIIYGVILMISASISLFNMHHIMTEIANMASNKNLMWVGFFAIFSTQALVALYGLFVSLRSKHA